jgi:hypothetical protein
MGLDVGDHERSLVGDADTVVDAGPLDQPPTDQESAPAAGVVLWEGVEAHEGST